MNGTVNHDADRISSAGLDCDRLGSGHAQWGVEFRRVSSAFSLDPSGLKKRTALRTDGLLRAEQSSDAGMRSYGANLRA